MGSLCRLAPAFGLSSIIRFAIRESVRSVRPAPRVFSDDRRRCGSAASAITCWRGVPFHGGKSSRRVAGRSRGFARTWASRAGKSASFNSRVSIGVVTTAGPCPPASEPADAQLPRPRAMSRTARSAASLERQMRPRNRATAAERALLIRSYNMKQVISKCYAVREIAGPR
jgi:hypothetical protein